MQVSVETTSNLGRRVTVIVPPAQVDAEVKTRLQSLGKTARIEGFRAGKVPARIIEQRFGASVRGEAVDKVLQTSLNAALQQEKLEPAGTPTIQSLKAEQGQPLEYVVTFEVFPEIKLQDMSDAMIEKTIVNIGEADIDTVLEQMRKQHAKWTEVTRASQIGDKLTLDFQWPSEEAANGVREQKNVAVVLEERTMTPEMTVLKGVKVGDNVQVQIVVQIKGKADGSKVKATAHVLKIEQPELPEINEAFAKQLDVTGGVEGLRKEVREHIQQQLDQTLKTKLRDQVVEKLLERHSMELPTELVAVEKNHMEQEFVSQQMRGRAMPAGATLQLPESVRENIAAMAQQRVKLSLLYSALIKEYALKVDFNRVRDRIEQMAIVFQQPAGMVERMLQDKETVNRVSLQILEDQVIEKLLEKIKYTEKTAAYADIMELAQVGNSAVLEDSAECHEHDHAHCDHEH